ncbi:MAG: hypothetical protein QOG62_685 [Thermoleophilaceae bacterium]|nr:hypothetical protein [Thermoleophilaceae bacterium]
MKPVNLLPVESRRAIASGNRSGISYYLVGGLAAVLVAVAVYAFVAHQVNESRAEAARIADQATAVEAQVTLLTPYGRFTDLRQQRVAAVTQLATGRLDWERLARELALVLPDGAWLTAFDGESVPATGGAPATDASGAVVGPKISLSGCARDQHTVADALVRLRRLNGAKSVELESSEHSVTDSKGGSSSKGSSSDGCGKFYAFTANVELDQPGIQNSDPATSQQVPTSLGGGS